MMIGTGPHLDSQSGLLCAGTAAVLLLAFGADLRADDDALLAGRSVLEARLADARSAGDDEALTAWIPDAVGLAREASALGAEGRETVVAIVKDVGTLTKEQNETVVLGAIAALGEIGHADGARALTPFLKPVGADEPDPRVMAAVRSAGRLASEIHVRPLLRVVNDSGDLATAREAMLALGCYRDAPRHRVKILAELVKSVEKCRPGTAGARADAGAPGETKDGAPPTRWDVLAPALPEALGVLTGRRLATAEDWIFLVRESRRDLEALFLGGA